ncbi:MAG: type II secretion system F family protein [Lachnospiraceae bacterium]|nr:type II secretion system F family protein [Lachnospiraceae bacterium]MDE6744888.1 type II secretion system F family protein [Lachnospiraceae bacterium]
MAQYAYRVMTPAGKEKKGTLEAKSRDAAMNMLKAEKNVVIQCEEAGAMSKNLSFSFGTKIKPRDFSIFCHQFESINKAGVSVVDSFEMLGTQTENPALQAAIKAVHTDISKGDSLATAMRKRKGVFPEMLLNMVEAGEASGSLDVAFMRMAIQFEKDAALQSAVKKAVTYPIILIVVMIAVIFVIMTFVIPSFMGMFADLDTEMPAITMVIVHVSDFFVAWWWLILIIGAVLFMAIKAYANTDSGKEVTSSLAVKLPVLGPVKTKSACARLGRTLCTLLAAGVPMVDAIDITGRNMENLLYKRAMKEAKEQVMRGVPLSRPLKSSGLFPPMVVHMVSIGEETGNIEVMLENVADYYEEDVQLATEQMMTIMEPAIIVVMAVVVGFLVIAILSPMFTLYDSLSS